MSLLEALQQRASFPQGSDAEPLIPSRTYLATERNLKNFLALRDDCGAHTSITGLLLAH